MTTDDHTPSRACYQRGCEDSACYRENYRYGKRLALEHVRGERRLADTTEVREHIARLIAAKWTQARIARTAGVPRSNVNVIVMGQPRTLKRTALAILAIPVTPVQDNTRVDATGTRRRLQALMVLGHSLATIGDRLTMTPDRLSEISRSQLAVVRTTEAVQIANLYREWSTILGTCRQVATAARNKKWHGPLAWDDIDNPKCKPEYLRRSEAKASTKPKVYADPDRVAALTAQHKSAAEIAQQLGCHKRTVVRIRARAAEPVAA